jgi:hypothetical protein
MKEEDLEQLAEDWKRIREAISEIKKENRALREDLAKAVLLSRTLYQFVGRDNLVRGENDRNEIVRLLKELDQRLEIDPPQ